MLEHEDGTDVDHAIYGLYVCLVGYVRRCGAKLRD